MVAFSFSQNKEGNLDKQFEIASKSHSFALGPDKKDEVSDPPRLFGKVIVDQNTELFNRFKPSNGKYPFVMYFSNHGKNYFEYKDKYLDV